MLRDLHHAVRVLLKTKAWTLVVILSLALGIGVNTTLFSAINGLLLETLPAQQPHELVRLRWSGDNQMMTSSSEYGYSNPTPSGQRVRATFSYEVYEQFRESNQTLTELFAAAPAGRVNMVVDGQAELASAFLSTGTYFQVLRIPAFVGRTLMPADDDAGAEAAAMISYGYWQRRFGGSTQVVGRQVSVNNLAVTIVGVTPPGYAGIQRLGESAPDVHLPLRLDREINQQDRLDRPTYWWLQVMGRLQPGATIAQVEGNLNGPFQEAAQAGWRSYYSELSDEQRARSRNQDRTAVPTLDVASGARGVYDARPSSARSMSILGVVVVVVLLIVCANVANLLLSRASSRRKEISIRLSMGATRQRLIRQLLTESVVLAGIGGLFALLVAYWSRQLLPVGQDAALDWRVFLFAATLSAATGVVFGLFPALRATRVDLAQVMNETGRSGSRPRGWLGKSLLVAQVALSLMLLIGAGLFLRTLQNLRSVDVGFETRNLLLVQVNPRVNRYEQDHIHRLAAEMRDAFAAVAGVESASFSQTALLAGSTWNSSMYVEGREDTDENVHMMIVSPEFLTTHQIPLLTGRNLTTTDNQESSEVALINEAAARQFFEEDNPLGRRFGFSPEDRGDIEVVGIVANAKYSSIRDEAPPTVYRPYLQGGLRSVTFELRTAMAPRSLLPAVREAARRVDPDLPLGNISTQAEEVEERFEQERVFALAYSLFGGLALLLASVGLFGLMSYNVSSRTNEIGIRMALGARQRGVISMMMRESLLLVAVGAALGLAGALAAGQLISTMLYDMAPSDPLTMIGATIIMFVVAGFAGFLPARRASRVDPNVALHYE